MNNKNQPMGYEIEFLGANNEPLAYCKAEMSINGLPTSEYPWQADENGRIVFPPSLVEQEGKELRIKVVFWNEQYPKTEHSEIPEFTWIKGKRLVRLRAYNIYEIKPRTIPNENNESATYKRPYHVVKKGDTWESIEKEVGISQYALFWVNGLDEATPLGTLVGKKIYFPKGMRDGKNKLKPTKIQNNSSVSHEHKKEINRELDNTKKNKDETALPEVSQQNKKEDKSSKDKSELIQERSENNEKAVDKVDKPCPDECKVAEIITFDTSKGKYIISKELWDFILATESYEKQPYVPGGGKDGKSGVTLGYGYDLGQQTKTTMYSELSEFYTQDQLKRLEVAIGVKGTKANELVASLSDITITKENAKRLAIVVKRRYAESVVSIYPEILKYHPHCQGSLLSLVYNRGSSLKGPSRQEMKDIQKSLEEDNASVVPSLIRSMKRLWNSSSNRGLVTRRENEAKWFEKGVKCDCF